MATKTPEQVMADITAAIASTNDANIASTTAFLNSSVKTALEKAKTQYNYQATHGWNSGERAAAKEIMEYFASTLSKIVPETNSKMNVAWTNSETKVLPPVIAEVKGLPAASTDTQIEEAAASVAGGRISDFQAEKWLGELVSGTWVALHYDNPDVSGAYASEVFGGSYTRLKLSMSSPANRATWNAGTLTFAGLPAITITHLGVWDAQYNGNLLYSTPLPVPLRVLSGSRQSFPAAMLAFSVD